MSKTQRLLKLGREKDVHRLEHTEVFDDNLLPDAAEIERLYRMDPTIIEWLKNCAEKEQVFRHSVVKKRTEIIDKHNRREHFTARAGLFIYLLLLGGCIVASYLLLNQGHTKEGSIFSGTAVILGLAVLIARRFNVGLGSSGKVPTADQN